MRMPRLIVATVRRLTGELESDEERAMFLEDLGPESGVGRLIKAAYKLLDLQTCFTTGVQETHAWTYAWYESSSVCRCYPYRF